MKTLAASTLVTLVAAAPGKIYQEKRDAQPMHEPRASDFSFQSSTNITAQLSKRAPPQLTSPVHIGLVAMPLGPFTEGAYFGETRLPSQGMDKPFHTAFDTTRGPFVVPSVFCEPEDGCPGDPSMKYQEHGTFRAHGVPPAAGIGSTTEFDIYSDTVTVGPTGILKVEDAPIKVIKRYGPGINNPQADYVPITFLGLSPHAAQLFPGPPLGLDWFTKAVVQGELVPLRREFSFFFGRARTGTVAMSQVTFGGRDPNLFTGPILKARQVPLSPTRQFFWQIFVPRIQVNGAMVIQWPVNPVNGRSAIFDTTSPWITTDDEIARTVFSHVDGAFPVNVRKDMLPDDDRAVTRSGLRAKPATKRNWVYPCDSKPVVGFNFGGHFFDVVPNDLIVGRIKPTQTEFVDVPGAARLQQALQGPPLCLSAWRSHDPSASAGPRQPIWDLIQLGTTFMKNWYTTFALPTFPQDTIGISFAKAIPGNEPAAYNIPFVSIFDNQYPADAPYLTGDDDSAVTAAVPNPAGPSNPGTLAVAGPADDLAAA